MIFTRIGIMLSRGVGGSDWDRGDIAAPHVFLDSDNDRWVMAYSGYDPTLTSDSGFTLGTWSLGIAYADYDAGDQYGGLGGPWTKEALNPVMTPDYAKEGYICCNGSIVTRVEGATRYYYHFYHGASSPPSGGPAVFVARSTDLVSWTRLNSGNAVIPVAVDPHCEANEQDVFECWYAADATDRDGYKAISSDGITWISRQMWYRPPYASDNMGEIAPLRSGSEFSTFHDMADTSSSAQRVIAKTYSADEHTTLSQVRNVFDKAPGGSDWDRTQVFDSSPVKFGNNLCLFYAGAIGAGYAQGMDSDIGLAVATYDESAVSSGSILPIIMQLIGA